ncbi:MAG: hypothetical protein ACD_63C00134G0002 [uncultured bacterium]|nr:MAG: hypothetical protein ACD_63C00134G0002 [uncultured bacterium]
MKKIIMTAGYVFYVLGALFFSLLGIAWVAFSGRGKFLV